MKTTVQLLDAIKTRHNLKSNNAIAPLLGCTISAISQFYNYKAVPSDETAVKIAELLSVDPAFVTACIQGERTKSAAVKAMWGRIAEHFGGVAAVLLLAVLVIPALNMSGSISPDFAVVSMTSLLSNNIHYAK